MPYILLIVVLVLFPASASAASEERKALYGTWGTPKQCSRAPLKPGGTVLAEPFEIDSQWLKQGTLWCRLNWFPVQPRKDGIFTGARAQCGEDSIRSYFLGMELSDDNLTLRWDFPLKNGPLARCSNS